MLLNEDANYTTTNKSLITRSKNLHKSELSIKKIFNNNFTIINDDSSMHNEDEEEYIVPTPEPRVELITQTMRLNRQKRFIKR